MSRQDGYLEREGTWAEAAVGALLASPVNPDQRWRVVAKAGREQIAHHTTWLRLREESTGEEYSLPPQDKRLPVTLLVGDPAEDADKLALLTEGLGAQVIATRDHATGEIRCPSYDGPAAADLIHHLKVCHWVNVAGFEAMSPSDQVRQAGEYHSQLHASGHSGGFPHQHA